MVDETTRSGKDSLISGGSALAGLAAGFGAVVLVAHQRGAAAAGVLFGAIGLYSILSTVAKLGTETTFVFYIGQLRGKGALDAEALRRLISMGLRPVVLCSLVLMCVVFGAAPQLAAVLIGQGNESDYAAALRVLAPFIPVWAITLPLLGAARGLGDLGPTAIGLQIVQPLMQLVLLAAALQLGASIAWLTLAWAAPLAVTLVIGARRIANEISDGAGESGQIGADVPAPREFWGHATPRGLAGTLSMAVDRLGVVLVGSLGSAALAGAWTAITRLLGVCLRVVHAMSQALNTKLPALLGRGRVNAAMGQARLATWWTIALLTPVLTVVAAFPTAALALFDMDGIDGAVAALRISVGAAAVTVVLAHVDNVLLMSGRSMLVLYDGLPSLAALVVLSAVLVPDHGLPGAAVAWVISAAIYRLLALTQVRRLHAAWILDRRIALDSLLLATGCAVIAGATRVGLGTSLFAASVAGAVCSALAVGLLLVSKRRLASGPPGEPRAMAHAT